MLDAFPDRVLNLHPALLPSFKGAHAIQDAFDAGVKVTGVTVHFANEDYDKGPIVAQRAVEVREDDTLDDLEAAHPRGRSTSCIPQVLQPRGRRPRAAWARTGKVHVASEARRCGETRRRASREARRKARGGEAQGSLVS